MSGLGGYGLYGALERRHMFSILCMTGEVLFIFIFKVYSAHKECSEHWAKIAFGLDDGATGYEERAVELYHGRLVIS